MREMRERTRALLDELHLPVSPDAPADSLLAGLSPAAAGRAGARVRVRHPRPRRADDVADRRGDRPPVRRAGQAEGARHDAALRVAPAARGLPAVRSHYGAARRRLRRDVRPTGGHARSRRPRHGRTRAAAARAFHASGPTRAAPPALSIDGLGRRPWFTTIFLTRECRRNRRSLRPRRVRPLGAARNGVRSPPPRGRADPRRRPGGRRLVAPRRDPRRDRARARGAATAGPVVQPDGAPQPRAAGARRRAAGRWSTRRGNDRQRRRWSRRGGSRRPGSKCRPTR